MIRGNIYDINDEPLEDVKVSVLDNDDYGWLLSKSNGTYTLGIEGGKDINVVYSKNGYISVHRKVYALPNDWTIVASVNMVKLDTKVTSIDLSNTNTQIHNSSTISDDRGSRSTTLVFNNITKATVTSKDGTKRVLDTFNLRATQFPKENSMPSNLPQASAYTYCADLSIDGVRDDETVSFDNPVIMYVDNFLALI